jgi:hypothetical protein
MPTSKMPCCLGQTLTDLLEHAKAVRRVPRTYEKTPQNSRDWSDRLQAREGAMALGRAGRSRSRVSSPSESETSLSASM